MLPVAFPTASQSTPPTITRPRRTSGGSAPIYPWTYPSFCVGLSNRKDCKDENLTKVSSAKSPSPHSVFLSIIYLSQPFHLIIVHSFPLSSLFLSLFYISRFLLFPFHLPQICPKLTHLPHKGFLWVPGVGGGTFAPSSHTSGRAAVCVCCGAFGDG